jgi:hypothetical protein
MQREAGIPSVVVTAIEAVLVLALLLAERWRAVLPAGDSGESGDAAHTTADASGPPAPTIA